MSTQPFNTDNMQKYASSNRLKHLPDEEKLRDAANRTLARRGVGQFVELFQAHASDELRRDYPHLTESQLYDITLETMRLFQRAATLDDPFIQQQLAAAKLPVDRILVDFHARQEKLFEMAGGAAQRMDMLAKRTLQIGGIAGAVGGFSIAGTFLALKEYVPTMPGWLRGVAGTLAGAAAFVGAGKIAVATFVKPYMRDPASEQKIEAQVAFDSGFVGEMLRMGAMQYAGGRAAAICAAPTEHQAEAARPNFVTRLNAEPEAARQIA